MPSYKISFEQIRQQPALTELLKALEKGFAKFGVDFYLVGAVSRDVWMNGINKIAPKRTTGDIDFAVFINDKGVFEQLYAYLIEEEGFRPTSAISCIIILICKRISSGMNILTCSKKKILNYPISPPG